MSPLATALWAVVKVTAHSGSRPVIISRACEVPRARGHKTVRTMTLVDPLDVTNRALVRVWRPHQEIISSCTHGAVNPGQPYQLPSVRIHCRPRTTSSARPPMLPVVVPVAQVGMSRVSALDRPGGRPHARQNGAYGAKRSLLT